MAVLEAGSNFQLIMNQPEDGGVIFPTIATFPSSLVVASSPTNVVMRYDDGWYNVISGNGLATDSDDVTAGVVTGIRSFSSDPGVAGATPDLTLSELHFDVAAQPESANPFGPAGLSGDDRMFGGGSNDLIRGFTGADTLYGDRGDDVLYGNQGNDVLYGNRDNDVLYGGQGDDTLFGGQGNDIVHGQAGNDVLHGNLGDDTLTGGVGADTFVFGRGSGSDRDTVTDFSAAEGDRIGLADGLSLTVAPDAAGNAVLTLSSGDTAVLLGVSASAVTADWFIVA
ncbi:calcium-binding protein [Azospirillum halopraeferens]|uniref:calcium-binding protein n=1 Tax=Azospirillum halopraeferens TaxID=34010 RepID=UPI0003FBEC4C|nr:calcium-binding protein [Azospirillum halopraeferens]